MKKIFKGRDDAHDTKHKAESLNTLDDLQDPLGMLALLVMVTISQSCRSLTLAHHRAPFMSLPEASGKTKLCCA